MQKTLGGVCEKKWAWKHQSEMHYEKFQLLKRKWKEIQWGWIRVGKTGGGVIKIKLVTSSQGNNTYERDSYAVPTPHVLPVDLLCQHSRPCVCAVKGISKLIWNYVGLAIRTQAVAHGGLRKHIRKTSAMTGLSHSPSISKEGSSSKLTVQIEHSSEKKKSTQTWWNVLTIEPEKDH